MPSGTQPAGFTMGKGMMVTIGVVINGDRTAIVMPMAYQGTPTDPNDVGQSAVDAVSSEVLPLLVPLISSDGYVSFVQAEGMLVGDIPARTNYAPTDWPGTGTAGAMPSQTAGLVVFYEDARDISVDAKKVSIGKAFIPGIPRDEVGGDTVSGAWQTKALTFALKLQNGFNSSTIETILQWYRVAGKPVSDPALPPPDASTKLNRIFACAGRGYVVTQRRRTIPR